MKHVRFASSLVQVAGCFLIAAVVIAWQPNDRKKTENKTGTANYGDTTSPKSADIDQIDLQLNLDSVMREVNVALSKIDYAKINADIQKAMAQIDYNKINVEINKAMKEIDWNEMKMDISRSLDSAKMAVDKINWDEMKIEMNKAQAEAKKAMAAQKINMDNIKVQVQKSLQDAQKSLQSARIELANYKALKNALQQDGLIQEGKPYTIQLKEGILYINGVKQTKAVSDKYSKYYSGKQNFMMKDDGGVDL